MNQRSLTLQKLYTLEEVSMAFWEVEKQRQARSDSKGNSLWMEPLSVNLHSIESSLIRKQGTILLESLRIEEKRLEDKINELNHSGMIPAGLGSRIEKAGESVRAMIALLEKENSA